MWQQWHRVLALALVLALVANACGGSDRGTGNGADGAMSIAGLCDPIEDAVAAYAGSNLRRDHLDDFVGDADVPTLKCRWVDDETGAQLISVQYWGDPQVWRGLVAAFERTPGLPGVPADNYYTDLDLLEIRAPNDWTISVNSFGVEAPDALASIGNAALDLVGAVEEMSQPDAGDGDVAAGMTIAGLCDPLEDQVVALMGAEVLVAHSDFYVDQDQLIACSWLDADSDWELGVGYNGSPDDLMIGFSEGKQDLAEIDAPNAYGTGRLDLRAVNGWTITITNYGADSVDAGAELVPLANAALDLAGS